MEQVLQSYRDKQVITEAEAAAQCGLSLVHFRRERQLGRGPRHVKLGIRRIGYRICDVLDWIEQRLSSKTGAAA
jgi:predicted DNA-binding transcriptional regulator AlpA